VTKSLSLSDLELCFEGVIPAVIATAAADGIPNVTYLSKVRMVDDERIALSNQFLSKTSRNLAENPPGSILLIHPLTYDQYRLTLVYERTERRGDVFERLSEDVDAVAALQGMLLLDEEGKRLYTNASKGYDVQGVGSEVTVGEGIIGMAAARCAPIQRMQDRDAADATQEGPAVSAQDPSKPSTHVRCFSVDGSTFLDGDYLIKGVSGRIMWSLLPQYDLEGRVEFTNREVRLDPTLELPEFRDNFESRLILLKRRLDERGAPIQIEKTGRGRFRLVVERPLRLEQV
jgi:hypothetical protein